MSISDPQDRRPGHIEGPGMGNLVAIFVFVVVILAAFIMLRPMARQPGYVETAPQRAAVATTNTTAPTSTDALGQAAPQVAPAR